MIPAGKITLHPVEEADQDFLLSVYASSRADEMARVPWSPEQKQAFVSMQFTAQSQNHAAGYPGASHEIICRDAAPVGRLYLDRRAGELHILDVTVLPQFRNSGIGTFLLRQILDEAGGSGKPVSIYVESFNPSLRLFRKLGFQAVAENGFQWLLRWSPTG